MATIHEMFGTLKVRGRLPRVFEICFQLRAELAREGGPNALAGTEPFEGGVRLAVKMLEMGQPPRDFILGGDGPASFLMPEAYARRLADGAAGQGAGG